MTPAIDLSPTAHAVSVAARLDVRGTVQGVGMRPFVFRLATELGLDGFVGNDTSSLFVEVSGRPPDVEEFIRRLVRDAPPMARIEHIDRHDISPSATRGFEIVESRARDGERSLVPPDSAPCGACVDELLDPEDRRYRHPFISCTNCGPRFTIARSLPYDRATTTMATFAMCDVCAIEYRNPADRRFHAQPIACHRCGPTLSLSLRDAVTSGGAAIDATVRALEAGDIVGLKGLGGFNLACDATDAAAVERLRSRKHRPAKPFAVMVRDLVAAAQIADFDGHEEAVLTSVAAPIVLLRARSGTSLAGNVTSGSPLVGVMLPSTPLHLLLLDAIRRPLVMTSGNLSGEPIAFRDDDVRDRIGHLCDGVLTHDRPIHASCDDSVVRVVDDELLPIRRARGYAPAPVRLRGAGRTVLAVGADIKSTFCLASADHAWLSPHLGDMANLETLAAFERSLGQYMRTYGVVPDVVAADLHPGYHSSAWARSRFPERLVEVQHHHAHVAATMAESGLSPTEQVIGVAFDGTGFGDDGTIWGGEVLVADAAGYERVGHLSPFPLPGGDTSARAPYRGALAQLAHLGIPWNDHLAPVRELADGEADQLLALIDSTVGSVPCSSMGRLFDAVASLLGLRHRITFEAQAAIDLEDAATTGRSDRGHRFAVDGGRFDSGPLLAGLVDDLLDGAPVPDLALTFHLAVVDLVVAAAERVRADRGLSIVALTGGVFQNALLLSWSASRLRDAGFTPLAHHVVPPNDGGLSLGQAYVAAHSQPDER